MNLRQRSKVIGVLFIAAAVFAVVGGLSYLPIVDNPDYLTDGPTWGTLIAAGAVFELLTAIAATGTALAFYPVLREYAHSTALGYLAFRLFEALLIVVGAISMLTILALRQDVAAGAVADPAALQGVDGALRSIHALSMIVGINFFLGVNTALYSSVLYRERLVPRPLAALGLLAAVGLVLAALVVIFGLVPRTSIVAVLLAVPIIVYEMSLAVYLIARGLGGEAAVDQSSSA